jgi:phage baseplate assembly protein V
MFRVGIVQAQDVPNCRVRVIFPDRNQMVSWWLPIIRQGTQNDKDYWIPDIGEQVVCLMDEHDEDGAVFGSIFSSADTTPSGATGDTRILAPKDGAVFSYNRATHALNVSLPNGGTVTVTANGATIEIDSSGVIHLISAGDIPLVTSSHSDSVNGIINTYNSHTHPDPQGGNTGAPNQQMS